MKIVDLHFLEVHSTGALICPHCGVECTKASRDTRFGQGPPQIGEFGFCWSCLQPNLLVQDGLLHKLEKRRDEDLPEPLRTSLQQLRQSKERRIIPVSMPILIARQIRP